MGKDCALAPALTDPSEVQEKKKFQTRAWWKKPAGTHQAQKAGGWTMHTGLNPVRSPKAATAQKVNGSAA
jgi:hypothetical protein